MGSCVSVHKNSSASGSAMKLVTFGPKCDKLVTPASPIIDDVTPARPVDGGPPIDSCHRENFGNKEEMFFDSQLWLESDCEDDFFSVNGEFTPSRGATPVHHCFSGNETPSQATEKHHPGSVTEPSPTDKKKKLVELFRETLDDNQEKEEEHDDEEAAKPKAKTMLLELLPAMRSSAPATPYVSGTTSFCNSEITVDGDSLTEKHRRVRSVNGCIPRLVSCGSFSERRRKMMSPAVSVDGKS